MFDKSYNWLYVLQWEIKIIQIIWTCLNYFHKYVKTQRLQDIFNLLLSAFMCWTNNFKIKQLLVLYAHVFGFLSSFWTLTKVVFFKFFFFVTPKPQGCRMITFMKISSLNCWSFRLSYKTIFFSFVIKIWWDSKIIVHLLTLEFCSWDDKKFNKFTWILYMFEHENFVHEVIETKTTWQKKVQV
jgi:hypothetical protein